MVEQIKISEVKVSDRFRTDAGDIESLKESIKRIGLLQPIGVTLDKTLVYGYRRLEAARSLGWEEIPYVLVDLDKTSQRLAELEENLKRKDMTWQEEIKGKAELHRLCQIFYGPPKAGYRSDLRQPLSDSEEGWSLKKLAKFLNESIGLVSQDIKLYKALEEHPELQEATTKSNALRLLEKIEHPKKVSRKEKEKKCDICGKKLVLEKNTLELCSICYDHAVRPPVTKVLEVTPVPEEVTKEDVQKTMTMQEWLGVKNNNQIASKKLTQTV